jgi:hypothetical protein
MANEEDSQEENGKAYGYGLLKDKAFPLSDEEIGSLSDDEIRDLVTHACMVIQPILWHLKMTFRMPNSHEIGFAITAIKNNDKVTLQTLFQMLTSPRQL